MSLLKGDHMDEKELEEKIEKMKEKRYLKSLSLLDLGRELGLAERAVERYREEGDEMKAEELEEYCEKVRREIDGRMGGRKE